MFNQQFLIACLIVLICLYLAVKIYSWWQGNQRSQFYGIWHKDNEQIGREGLMIQLEEVRKQRDEIATQLMIFRLQAQKVDSNEPIREPELYKGFVDHLKKMNHETKRKLHEVHSAYSESQRELRGLKDVSVRFVNDFQSLEDDNDVSEMITAHYGNLKTLLK